MKVALIAGNDWLSVEASTFRRLSIGLVDERVNVLRVVPDEGIGGQIEFAGKAISYGSTDWGLLRQWRLFQTLRRLREAKVDLIHVLDGEFQLVGRVLARRLGVPVVCSLWSKQDVDRAHLARVGSPTAYICPTASLTRYCKQRVSEVAVVELVRPGVHVAEEVRPPLGNVEASVSCLVIGDGRADDHYRAMLAGFSAARSELPQAMLFHYAFTHEQHHLWQVCREMGLLDQVTIVPHDPEHRDILVQADVVVQPQVSGRVRTLTLAAMGSARPVIATADPMLDYLVQSDTAQLVDVAAPEGWSRCFRDLVSKPRTYQALGESARRYVAARHSAAAFVNGTLEVYRRITEPEPLPFAG